MTKLEGVYRMLRSLNEAPFAALDTGGTSVASRAETLLDQYDKTIQAEGWHVNKEFKSELLKSETKNREAWTPLHIA